MGEFSKVHRQASLAYQASVKRPCHRKLERRQGPTPRSWSFKLYRSIMACVYSHRGTSTTHMRASECTGAGRNWGVDYQGQQGDKITPICGKNRQNYGIYWGTKSVDTHAHRCERKVSKEPRDWRVDLELSWADFPPSIWVPKYRSKKCNSDDVCKQKGQTKATGSKESIWRPPYLLKCKNS